MTGHGLDTILLTGASGFIGRHLIEVLKDRYTIFAVARRSQREAGVAAHPNVHWFLVDITDEASLSAVVRDWLRSRGSIDYLIHLAAYYDFGDQVYGDIYEQTNVVATQRLLELGRHCRLKRFLFASSVVASEFPAAGDLVYEKSPLDAEFPYAVTKRRGEEMAREFSDHFPCSVIRLAAVFSDWCEYEPLYHMFNRWLVPRWDARIFVGRRGVAIPYIHIANVTCLLRTILARSDELAPFDVYLASPDRPTSLLEIREMAVQLFGDGSRDPIHLPVWLGRAGLVGCDAWGRLRGTRPFERMWMTRYIDREFPVDGSYTREVLGWKPKERLEIEHRLLFLVENLKSVPEEWHRRNRVRIDRFRTQRPSLTLAQEMIACREEIVDEILATITDPARGTIFPYYQQLDDGRLRYFIDRQFGNLFTSVRHGDRSIMIGFARDLARVRYGEGVELAELITAMRVTGNVITRRLYDDPRLRTMKMLVQDNISLAVQLAIDVIEDTYEELDLVHETV